MQCNSEAKISLYDTHKKDLKALKQIVKKYLPSDYCAIFNQIKKDASNYVAYSGFCSKAKGSKKDFKRANKEDFYAFIKKTISAINATDDDQKTINSILERINNTV